MRGLPLVAASRGHSSSRCAGLSPSRPLLLRSTGSRRTGSAIVAHGPSCSAACGIFPDQGSNPCPLHWQADSQPLRHQGSPILFIFDHWVLRGQLAKLTEEWPAKCEMFVFCIICTSIKCLLQRSCFIFKLEKGGKSRIFTTRFFHFFKGKGKELIFSYYKSGIFHHRKKRT